MVRIRLRFGKEIVGQPITSKVILEQKTQIRILTAHVNQEGGEIVAEVESTNAKKVIEAFRERGVTVDVRKLIEVDREKCTDCGACYSLCPVEGIAFQEDYQVDFNEEKCLGTTCGLCVNACPTRAIRLL